jgi:hypothetical protein
VRLSVGVEDVEDLWRDLSRGAGGRGCRRTGAEPPGAPKPQRSDRAARDIMALSICFGVMSPSTTVVHRLHDGHLHAVASRQLAQRAARLDPLGDLPRRRRHLGDRHAGAELLTEGAVARQR